VHRRLAVCGHWIRGRTNHVGLAEVARFVADAPCTWKARRQILRVEEHGSYRAITLRGISSPLYWPKEVDPYHLAMVIGESRYPRDWHFYEVPGMEVGPDDVVVDCGAAEGLFSLLAAQRGAHVFAIEPLAVWRGALERTFAGMPNVELMPVALGRAPGQVHMEGGALSSVVSTGSGAGAVSLETIDRLFFERGLRPTYIKADLEGFECEMLTGAEQTIRRWSPRIAITTYHRAHHAEQITDMLRSFDPRYQITVRGIEAATGSPVMLHARRAG